MIATRQPTTAQWSAGSLAPERSGSLRRIDDILSELLAGYPLAADADVPASAGNSLSRMHAAAGAPPIGSATADSPFAENSMADASPAEMC